MKIYAVINVFEMIAIFARSGTKEKISFVKRQPGVEALTGLMGLMGRAGGELVIDITQRGQVFDACLVPGW